MQPDFWIPASAAIAKKLFRGKDIRVQECNSSSRNSSQPECFAMSLPIAFGLYFICWWLVFFMVLPIGNRVPDDVYERDPGMADSAPENPRLWLKAGLATAGSALLFGIVYVVISYRLIPLAAIFPSIG
jgi:predicted secreted protein